MPEARQNNSKLAEMLARASIFRALVGMAVNVLGLFMALLSFVESAPRAYRLKASNAAPPFSTSAGTSAKSDPADTSAPFNLGNAAGQRPSCRSGSGFQNCDAGRSGICPGLVQSWRFVGRPGSPRCGHRMLAQG